MNDIELFVMPKEPKPRKQHVRTQRYICKHCKRQSHGNDFCMCWKFDIALEFKQDGTAWTGNGNESVVCDGHEIKIGGAQ